MSSKWQSKSDDPLVSIIVPCFNHGAVIGETLASLRAQTRQDYEVIIVDDASTDEGTQTVLGKLAAEGWRVIFLPVNGGPAKARNKGIAEARGEFILPLDADDLLTPEYLEKTLQVMLGEDAGGIRVVYTGAQYFGAREDEAIWPAYEFPLALIEPMVPATCLFRRADWETVGGYSENMREAWEDFDFFIGLAGLGGRMVKIDEPLFLYRQTADASSRNHWVDSPERAGRLFRKILQNRQSVYARYAEALLPTLIDARLRLQVFEQVLPERLRWCFRFLPEEPAREGREWFQERWQRQFCELQPEHGGRVYWYPFGHPGVIQGVALEYWRAGKLLHRWRGEAMERRIEAIGSMIFRGEGVWQSFGADPGWLIDPQVGSVQAGDRLAWWVRGEVEPKHLVEATRLTAEAVHERDFFRREKAERVLEKAYLDEVARRRWRQTSGWRRLLWGNSLLRRRWLKQNRTAPPIASRKIGSIELWAPAEEGQYGQIKSADPLYLVMWVTPEDCHPVLPADPYWVQFTLDPVPSTPACLVVAPKRNEWKILARWGGSEARSKRLMR